MKRIALTSLGFILSGVAALSIAQTAQIPAFEVASVKQVEFRDDAYFASYVNGLGGPCAPRQPIISGERVTLNALSLCGLLATAYDLRDYNVSVPDWIKKQDRSLYYEIQAVSANASTPLTMKSARQMLQVLLSDRFQLKAHWEMKELPVYALVVGKNGTKLTLSPQGTCSHFPNASIMGDGLIVSCDPVETMDELAEGLSRYTDRPVLNRTGIGGGQVYELQWADNTVDIEAVTSRPSEGGSLFTAIQKQLGLRLDPTTAMVEVLVVDSVRKPSEN